MAHGAGIITFWSLFGCFFFALVVVPNVWWLTIYSMNGSDEQFKQSEEEKMPPEVVGQILRGDSMDQNILPTNLALGVDTDSYRSTHK